MTDQNNNIGLVRLVAACQVMVGHLLDLVPGAHTEVTRVTGYLPGVPVFFFLSGFLITGSWMRYPHLRAFTVRRILRIYPALWVTLALSTAALATLYAAPIEEHPATFAAWFVAQASFLQSWNPDFLRGYGVGVVNGSLWTIPLELTFYLMTPCLLMLGNRIGRPVWVIIATMTISGLSYAIFVCTFGPMKPTPFLVKVFTLSPFAAITWFWMFGFGMLAYLFRTILIPLASGHLWAFSSVFIVVCITASCYPIPGVLDWRGGNLGLVNFLAIAALALSFAFSFQGLSRRLIGATDLSYGIYVYHAPVLNVVLAQHQTGDSAVAAALLTTCLLAAASWFFIEQPSLQSASRLVDRVVSYGHVRP